MPLKYYALLITGVTLLFSCTSKRIELPDYTGVGIRQIIAERSRIEAVETTFHVEFEKGDSTMTGDAALKLTDKNLELRIYSLGFLMAEIKESEGIITSTPELSKNKSIILVDGLRNSIFWWRIKNYTTEESNGVYHLWNSWQRILIDKKTMLPLSQTLELEDGKELRIYYEEPANSGALWYPSKMRIELSRYLVRLKIKNIEFIPHLNQDQQQQPL